MNRGQEGTQMASNEQMRTEFSIFREVWLFFKRFYGIGREDGSWSVLVREADSIAARYKDSLLCRDLLNAVVSELERSDIPK